MDNLTKLVELTKGTSLSEYENRIYVSGENANRTIYLADLPRNTSYMDISNFFESNVGTCLISIKRPLFKNFYFAFVQFQKLEHAEKVLEEYRFPMIKGAKCRALPYSLQGGFTSGAIKSAKRDSEPGTQIFVKNCPKEWTHEDLYQEFVSFGEISSAKISIDANFQSRGYGFVEFKDAESAQKAISESNGKEVSAVESSDNDSESKKELMVAEYEPKQARSRESQKCSSNLYVKNFPQTSTEFGDNDLLKLFEPYGEIQNAVVMKDADQKSKGFGFVCFKNWQDAQKAIDAFNKERGDSEQEEEPKLYVNESKSKEQRQLEIAKKTYQFKKSMMYMNLIVKNVEPSTSEEELTDFFSQFGNVGNVKIISEASLAFVSFKDRESARASKQAASEMLFKGRHLYASFCEPKEQRRLYFEEKMDKKAYEKHQLSVLSSKNSDLISLITSLGLIMGQLGLQNNQNYQRRTQTYNRTQFQQPINGAIQAQQQQNQRRYQNGGNRRNQYQGRNMMQMPQVQGQGMFQQPLVTGQVMMQPPGAQTIPQPMMMQTPGFSQQPQMDTRAAAYGSEIFSMFNSKDFIDSTSEHRKEIVGTAIYKHISDLVGDDHAPKVTGMIIDLEPAELNMSIQTHAGLQQKVTSAMQLLVNNKMVDAPPAASEQVS